MSGARNSLDVGYTIGAEAGSIDMCYSERFFRGLT